MQILRVESFSISVDGFGAGPNQSLENPLGEVVQNCINGSIQHTFFKKMYWGRMRAQPGLIMTLQNGDLTILVLGF